MNIIRKIGICFLYICITLIACELFLRVFVYNAQKYYIRVPFMNRTFRPIPGNMPGIDRDSLYQTNSLGIRADEMPKDRAYRILTIGGSTTESLFVNQTDTWSYLLQNKLQNAMPKEKVWVGNAGRSGLYTRHHVVEFYTVVPQIPVNTIIVLAGVNDLSQRLKDDTDYHPSSIRETLNNDYLYQQIFDIYPRENVFVAKIHSLALYRAYIVLKYYINALQHKEFIDEAGSLYIGRRENRKNATVIRNQLPDLTTSLVEYRKNLLEMVSYAKKHHIRLVLVTQPTIWKKDLPPDLRALLWFGESGVSKNGMLPAYYSVEALADGMQVYNDAMLEVCTSTATECVDLASMVQKDTTTFFDDCHFNYSGSEKVAEILATYLIQNPK